MTMLRPLQISNPWERTLVRLADAVTGPLGWTQPGWKPFHGRPRTPRAVPTSPPVQRVLLLRLERIGDLVMALDGIAQVRAQFPAAEIDLVVGSWNASLAALVPTVNRVEILDAPWLARGSAGATWRQLFASAFGWRARHYDLAVNFEPDIRSNFLVWLSGSGRRIGYWTAGGGPFLTAALAFQPSQHVSANAVRLSASAGAATQPPATASTTAPLEIPAAARMRVLSLLRGHQAPIIGLHVGAGRAIKQWPTQHFRELANWLIGQGATIVLTGDESDRPLVARVRAGLPEDRVLDVCGTLDIVDLSALLAQLDVVVTGDTGPMHIAQAVGTPTVSIFGPSDPARYAPSGERHRVIRIDLPCSPCNRIRQPPDRCAGHTPDCLSGIAVDRVHEAVIEVLRQPVSRRAPAEQDRG